MITIITTIRCALSSKPELKEIASYELCDRYGNRYGQFLISTIKKYPESFFDIPEEFILLVEQVYKEKTRVLTFESILELYKAGYKKAAEAELIYKYGKFVYYIMGKYFPTYKDRYKEDLFQCGCIGILNAIENYRPGTSFTTYSQYYIRHEMMVFTHFITNTPSRHYADLQKKIKAAISECELLGLNDSEQNLAILTGLSLKIIRQEKQFLETTDFLYLDAMENADMIFHGDTESPEAIFIKCESLENIKQSLQKLKPLTLKIIIFHVFEEYSFPSIAKYLDMPIWKIRDLYYDGLKKLRKDPYLLNIQHSHS